MGSRSVLHRDADVLRPCDTRSLGLRTWRDGALDGPGREPIGVLVDTFSQRIEEKDGKTVVYLEGELDLAGVPVLREALHAARQGPASQIVVDLRGLRFLDASGLGELIAPDSAGRDGHVAVSFVRGDNPVVNRVFQLTGMEGRLSWTEAPD